jgi:pyocin large subunit-like protein
MKLNDIIQKPARRQVMILTERQLQTLASRVTHLMEHGQIIRTYLIKKKSNGKQFK